MDVLAYVAAEPRWIRLSRWVDAAYAGVGFSWPALLLSAQAAVEAGDLLPPEKTPAQVPERSGADTDVGIERAGAAQTSPVGIVVADTHHSSVGISATAAAGADSRTSETPHVALDPAQDMPPEWFPVHSSTDPLCSALARALNLDGSHALRAALADWLAENLRYYRKVFVPDRLKESRKQESARRHAYDAANSADPAGTSLQEKELRKRYERWFQRQLDGRLQWAMGNLRDFGTDFDARSEDTGGLTEQELLTLAGDQFRANLVLHHPEGTISRGTADYWRPTLHLRQSLSGHYEIGMDSDKSLWAPVHPTPPAAAPIPGAIPRKQIPPALDRMLASRQLPLLDGAVIGKRYTGENRPLRSLTTLDLAESITIDRGRLEIETRTVTVPAHYMTPKEREQHRLFIGPGGRLYQVRDGAPFHSSGARFVMDEFGNLYSGSTSAVTFHSSFLAGRTVTAAGYLVVDDGRVQVMTDHSGHYEPTPQMNDYAVDLLRRQGLVLSDSFQRRGADYDTQMGLGGPVRERVGELERQTAETARLGRWLDAHDWVLRSREQSADTGFVRQQLRAERHRLTEQQKDLDSWKRLLGSGQVRPSHRLDLWAHPEPVDANDRIVPPGFPADVGADGTTALRPDQDAKLATWWNEHGREWWNSLHFSDLAPEYQRRLVQDFPGLRTSVEIPLAVRNTLNRGYLEAELRAAATDSAAHRLPQALGTLIMLVGAELDAQLDAVRAGTAAGPVHLVNFDPAGSSDPAFHVESISLANEAQRKYFTAPDNDVTALPGSIAWLAAEPPGSPDRTMPYTTAKFLGSDTGLMVSDTLRRLVHVGAADSLRVLRRLDDNEVEVLLPDGGEIVLSGILLAAAFREEQQADGSTVLYPNGTGVFVLNHAADGAINLHGPAFPVRSVMEDGDPMVLYVAGAENSGWFEIDTNRLDVADGRDTRPLYGDSGVPVPGDLSRDATGDGYLTATLVELAASNPALLQDMIRTTATDSGRLFQVRFFDPEQDNWKWVAVDDTFYTGAAGNMMYPLTDPSQPLWPAVIEKAWAVFRGAEYPRISSASTETELMPSPQPFIVSSAAVAQPTAADVPGQSQLAQSPAGRPEVVQQASFERRRARDLLGGFVSELGRALRRRPPTNSMATQPTGWWRRHAGRAGELLRHVGRNEPVGVGNPAVIDFRVPTAASERYVPTPVSERSQSQSERVDGSPFRGGADEAAVAGALNPAVEGVSAPEGAVWKSMPGDGNCLFHALAVVLRMEGVDAHEDLRAAVVEGLSARAADDWTGFFGDFMAGEPEHLRHTEFERQLANLLRGSEFMDPAAELFMPFVVRELGLNVDIAYPGGGLKALRHGPGLPVYTLLRATGDGDGHYHVAVDNNGAALGVPEVGRVDADGVRRFDTNADGAAYADRYLAGMKDFQGPAWLKLRQAVHAYEKETWTNLIVRNIAGVDARDAEIGSYIEQLKRAVRIVEVLKGQDHYDLPTVAELEEDRARLVAEGATAESSEHLKLVEEILSDASREARLEELGERDELFYSLLDYFGSTEDLLWKDVLAQVTLLDQATGQPLRLHEPVQVVRIVGDINFMVGAQGRPLGNGDPRELIGTVQTEPGYLSTSVGAETIVSLADSYRLELTVRPGANGMYIGKDSVAPGGDQQELLLPRGTRYRITDVRVAANGQTILAAEVLPPQGVAVDNQEGTAQPYRGGGVSQSTARDRSGRSGPARQQRAADLPSVVAPGRAAGVPVEPVAAQQAGSGRRRTRDVVGDFAGRLSQTLRRRRPATNPAATLPAGWWRRRSGRTSEFVPDVGRNEAVPVDNSSVAETRVPTPVSDRSQSRSEQVEEAPIRDGGDAAAVVATLDPVVEGVSAPSGGLWKSMPGDGNCLFHALATVLHMEGADAHGDLRADVVTGLSARSEQDWAAAFRDFMVGEQEDVRKRDFALQLANLLRDSEFMDPAAELFLPFVVRELGLNVNIVYPSGVTEGLRHGPGLPVYTLLRATGDGAGHYHVAVANDGAVLGTSDVGQVGADGVRRFDTNDDGAAYAGRYLTGMKDFRDRKWFKLRQAVHAYEKQAEVNGVVRSITDADIRTAITEYVEPLRQAVDLLEVLKNGVGTSELPSVPELEEARALLMAEEASADSNELLNNIDEILNSSSPGKRLEDLATKEKTLYTLMDYFHTTEEFVAKSLLSQIALLDQATGRPLRLPEPIQVVRIVNDVKFMVGPQGLPLEGRDPTELIDTVQTEPGYLSTSVGTETIVSLAGGYLLELTVRPGAKGLYIGRDGVAFGGDQQELLLPRGTRYRITGVRKNSTTSLTILTAEVLPPHSAATGTPETTALPYRAGGITQSTRRDPSGRSGISHQETTSGRTRTGNVVGDSVERLGRALRRRRPATTPTVTQQTGWWRRHRRRTTDFLRRFGRNDAVHVGNPIVAESRVPTSVHEQSQSRRELTSNQPVDEPVVVPTADEPVAVPVADESIAVPPADQRGQVDTSEPVAPPSTIGAGPAATPLRPHGHHAGSVTTAEGEIPAVPVSDEGPIPLVPRGTVTETQPIQPRRIERIQLPDPGLVTADGRPMVPLPGGLLNLGGNAARYRSVDGVNQLRVTGANGTGWVFETALTSAGFEYDESAGQWRQFAVVEGLNSVDRQVPVRLAEGEQVVRGRTGRSGNRPGIWLTRSDGLPAQVRVFVDQLAQLGLPERLRRLSGSLWDETSGPVPGDLAHLPDSPAVAHLRRLAAADPGRIQAMIRVTPDGEASDVHLMVNGTPQWVRMDRRTALPGPAANLSWTGYPAWPAVVLEAYTAAREWAALEQAQHVAEPLTVSEADNQAAPRGTAQLSNDAADLTPQVERHVALRPTGTTEIDADGERWLTLIETDTHVEVRRSWSWLTENHYVFVAAGRFLHRVASGPIGLAPDVELNITPALRVSPAREHVLTAAVVDEFDSTRTLPAGESVRIRDDMNLPGLVRLDAAGGSVAVGHNVIQAMGLPIAHDLEGPVWRASGPSIHDLAGLPDSPAVRQLRELVEFESEIITSRMRMNLDGTVDVHLMVEGMPRWVRVDRVSDQPWDLRQPIWAALILRAFEAVAAGTLHAAYGHRAPLMGDTAMPVPERNIEELDLDTVLPDAAHHDTLPDDQLEQLRLAVGPDGRLYRAGDGSLFGTSGRRAVLVMDQNANLYAAQLVGGGDQRVTHAALLGGGRAAIAAQIEARDGIISVIIDRGGEYPITASLNDAAIGQLMAHLGLRLAPDVRFMAFDAENAREVDRTAVSLGARLRLVGPDLHTFLSARLTPFEGGFLLHQATTETRRWLGGQDMLQVTGADRTGWVVADILREHGYRWQRSTGRLYRSMEIDVIMAADGEPRRITVFDTDRVLIPAGPHGTLLRLHHEGNELLVTEQVAGQLGLAPRTALRGVLWNGSGPRLRDLDHLPNTEQVRGLRTAIASSRNGIRHRLHENADGSVDVLLGEGQQAHWVRVSRSTDLPWQPDSDQPIWPAILLAAITIDNADNAVRNRALDPLDPPGELPPPNSVAVPQVEDVVPGLFSSDALGALGDVVAESGSAAVPVVDVVPQVEDVVPGLFSSDALGALGDVVAESGSAAVPVVDVVPALFSSDALGALGDVVAEGVSPAAPPELRVVSGTTPDNNDGAPGSSDSVARQLPSGPIPLAPFVSKMNDQPVAPAPSRIRLPQIGVSTDRGLPILPSANGALRSPNRPWNRYTDNGTLSYRVSGSNGAGWIREAELLAAGFRLSADGHAFRRAADLPGINGPVTVYDGERVDIDRSGERPDEYDGHMLLQLPGRSVWVQEIAAAVYGLFRPTPLRGPLWAESGPQATDLDGLAGPEVAQLRELVGDHPEFLRNMFRANDDDTVDVRLVAGERARWIRVDRFFNRSLVWPDDRPIWPLLVLMANEHAAAHTAVSAAQRHDRRAPTEVIWNGETRIIDGVTHFDVIVPTTPETSGWFTEEALTDMGGDNDPGHRMFVLPPAPTLPLHAEADRTVLRQAGPPVYSAALPGGPLYLTPHDVADEEAVVRAPVGDRIAMPAWQLVTDLGVSIRPFPDGSLVRLDAEIEVDDDDTPRTTGEWVWVAGGNGQGWVAAEDLTRAGFERVGDSLEYRRMARINTAGGVVTLNDGETVEVTTGSGNQVRLRQVGGETFVVDRAVVADLGLRVLRRLDGQLWRPTSPRAADLNVFTRMPGAVNPEALAQLHELTAADPAVVRSMVRDAPDDAGAAEVRLVVGGRPRWVRVSRTGDWHGVLNNSHVMWPHLILAAQQHIEQRYAASAQQPEHSIQFPVEESPPPGYAEVDESSGLAIEDAVDSDSTDTNVVRLRGAGVDGPGSAAGVFAFGEVRDRIAGIRAPGVDGVWESQPGTGNCLWEALARAVGIDVADRDAHRDFRVGVVQKMLANPDAYLGEFMASKPVAERRAEFMQQLRELLEDGTWNSDAADYLLPSAAAALKLNVDVYDSNGVVTQLHFGPPMQQLNSFMLNRAGSGAHYWVAVHRRSGAVVDTLDFQHVPGDLHGRIGHSTRGGMEASDSSSTQQHSDPTPAALEHDDFSWLDDADAAIDAMEPQSVAADLGQIDHSWVDDARATIDEQELLSAAAVFGRTGTSTAVANPQLDQVSELLGGEPVQITIESAEAQLRTPSIGVVFRDESGALVYATTRANKASTLLGFKLPDGRSTTTTFDRLRRLRGVGEVWIRRDAFDSIAWELPTRKQPEIPQLDPSAVAAAVDAKVVETRKSPSDEVVPVPLNTAAVQLRWPRTRFMYRDAEGRWVKGSTSKQDGMEFRRSMGVELYYREGGRSVRKKWGVDSFLMNLANQGVGEIWLRRRGPDDRPDVLPGLPPQADEGQRDRLLRAGLQEILVEPSGDCLYESILRSSGARLLPPRWRNVVDLRREVMIWLVRQQVWDRDEYGLRGWSRNQLEDALRPGEWANPVADIAPIALGNMLSEYGISLQVVSGSEFRTGADGSAEFIREGEVQSFGPANGMRLTVLHVGRAHYNATIAMLSGDGEALNSELLEVRKMLRGVPVRISIESAMEQVQRTGVEIVFRDRNEVLVRAKTSIRSSTSAVILNFKKPDGNSTQSSFRALRENHGVREVWVPQDVLDPAAGQSHLGAQSEVIERQRNVDDQQNAILSLEDSDLGAFATSELLDDDDFTWLDDLLPSEGPADLAGEQPVSIQHAQQPPAPAAVREIGEWSGEHAQWFDLDSSATEGRSATVLGPDARNLFSALSTRSVRESDAYDLEQGWSSPTKKRRGAAATDPDPLTVTDDPETNVAGLRGGKADESISTTMGLLSPVGGEVRAQIGGVHAPGADGVWESQPGAGNCLWEALARAVGVDITDRDAHRDFRVGVVQKMLANPDAYLGEFMVSERSAAVRRAEFVRQLTELLKEGTWNSDAADYLLPSAAAALALNVDVYDSDGGVAHLHFGPPEQQLNTFMLNRDDGDAHYWVAVHGRGGAVVDTVGFEHVPGELSSRTEHSTRGGMDVAGGRGARQRSADEVGAQSHHDPGLSTTSMPESPRADTADFLDFGADLVAMFVTEPGATATQFDSAVVPAAVTSDAQPPAGLMVSMPAARFRLPNDHVFVKKADGNLAPIGMTSTLTETGTSIVRGLTIHEVRQTDGTSMGIPAAVLAEAFEYNSAQNSWSPIRSGLFCVDDTHTVVQWRDSSVAIRMDYHVPPNIELLRPDGGWLPVEIEGTLRIMTGTATGPLYLNGGPQPGDVRQGMIGDCYLLSNLVGLAGRHPDLIVDMIREDVTAQQRTFSVRFYDAANKSPVWVKVDDTFYQSADGRMIYAAHDATLPLWPAVIEKAWAVFRGADRGYQGIDGGLSGLVAGQLRPPLMPGIAGRTQSTHSAQEAVVKFWFEMDQETLTSMLGESAGLAQMIISWEGRQASAEILFDELECASLEADIAVADVGLMPSDLRTKDLTELAAIVDNEHMAAAIMDALPNWPSDGSADSNLAKFLADQWKASAAPLYKLFDAWEADSALTDTTTAVWVAERIDYLLQRGDTVSMGTRQNAGVGRPTAVQLHPEHSYSVLRVNRAATVNGGLGAPTSVVVRDPHRDAEITVPVEHLNQFERIGSSGPGTLAMYGLSDGIATTSATTRPAVTETGPGHAAEPAAGPPLVPRATRPDVSQWGEVVVEAPAVPRATRPDVSQSPEVIVQGPPVPHASRPDVSGASMSVVDEVATDGVEDASLSLPEGWEYLREQFVAADTGLVADRRPVFAGTDIRVPERRTAAEWLSFDGVRPVDGKPMEPDEDYEPISIADREKFRIVVGPDGRLYSADGAVFDTVWAAEQGSGSTRDFAALQSDPHVPERRAMMVMDVYGNMYALTKEQQRRYGRSQDITHASLLGGAPAAAAAEIEVRAGVLRVLVDWGSEYDYEDEPTDIVLAELNSAALSYLRAQRIGLRIDADFEHLSYAEAANMPVPVPAPSPVVDEARARERLPAAAVRIPDGRTITFAAAGGVVSLAGGSTVAVRVDEADPVQVSVREPGDSGVWHRVERKLLTDAGVRVPTVKRVAGPLFGLDDMPRASDVKQGGAGTCYLLADLIGLADRHPEWVRQMVRSRSDGDLEVRFIEQDGNGRTVSATGEVQFTEPIRREVWVPVDRRFHAYDRQMAYAAHEDGQPLWPAVIEKAWAIYRGGDKGYAGIEGGVSGATSSVLWPANPPGAAGRTLPISVVDDPAFAHPLMVGPDALAQLTGGSYEVAHELLDLEHDWHDYLEKWTAPGTWDKAVAEWSRIAGLGLSESDARSTHARWLNAHDPRTAAGFRTFLEEKLGAERSQQLEPQLRLIYAEMTRWESPAPLDDSVVRQWVADRIANLLQRGDTVIMNTRPLPDGATRHADTGLSHNHAHFLSGVVVEEQTGRVTGLRLIDSNVRQSGDRSRDEVVVSLRHLNQFAYLSSAGPGTRFAHGLDRVALPFAPYYVGSPEQVPADSHHSADFIATTSSSAPDGVEGTSLPEGWETFRAQFTEPDTEPVAEQDSRPLFAGTDIRVPERNTTADRLFTGRPMEPGTEYEPISFADREKFRIVLGPDGRLYSADGAVFDTVWAAERGSGSTLDFEALPSGPSAQERLAVMVTDEYGNMYAVTKEQQRRYGHGRVFTHASLLGGAPAAAAVEVEVRAGVLRVMVDSDAECDYANEPSDMTDLNVAVLLHLSGQTAGLQTHDDFEYLSFQAFEELSFEEAAGEFTPVPTPAAVDMAQAKERIPAAALRIPGDTPITFVAAGQTVTLAAGTIVAMRIDADDPARVSVRVPGGSDGTSVWHQVDREVLVDAGVLVPNMVHVSGPLFGLGDVPRASDVQQGGAGTCYLLADLIGLAERHPDWVRQMIRTRTDGDYEVRFIEQDSDGRVTSATGEVQFTSPVRREVWVPVDRRFYAYDGQMAYAAHRDGQPLWPAVIEKAWATYRGGSEGYAGIEGGFAGETASSLWPADSLGAAGRILPIRAVDDTAFAHPLMLGPDALAELVGGSHEVAHELLGLEHAWHDYMESWAGHSTWDKALAEWHRIEGLGLSLGAASSMITQWLNAHDPRSATGFHTFLTETLGSERFRQLTPQLEPVLAEMTRWESVAPLNDSVVTRWVADRIANLLRRGDTVVMTTRPLPGGANAHADSGLTARHSYFVSEVVVEEESGMVTGLRLIDSNGDSFRDEVVVPLRHLNQFWTLASAGPGSRSAYGWDKVASTHGPYEPVPEAPAVQASAADSAAAVDFFDPTAFGR
ncbi:C2 family cysteine protease [Nocardia suismassiliense]|uniref:C2 family cysteine protease n=1 Tax=Nocardia suismassiliense TaxID=2077092 RepID=UPI001F1B63D5|nr:C2 family cysteine protease [Nocardia suismassiliense]